MTDKVKCQTEAKKAMASQPDSAPPPWLQKMMAAGMMGFQPPWALMQAFGGPPVFPGAVLMPPPVVGFQPLTKTSSPTTNLASPVHTSPSGVKCSAPIDFRDTDVWLASLDSDAI